MSNPDIAHALTAFKQRVVAQWDEMDAARDRTQPVITQSLNMPMIRLVN